ncbi:CCA tRNA nucleotidyltransferase [Limosilactobacillus mucosae]
MKIEKLPAIFEPARPILQRIEQAGFEAYFVGGCVRDTILGDEIHDIDIATSAYPAEIKQIFTRTVDTGIEHGTVMILDHGVGYETTTFRTESGYQDFRRPDSVTFVRSLAEDLKRRDFTINALALKENGEVIDLFDGLGDLKRHLIKAVGEPAERFHEDALRMMRAVRFASKLDFQIDEKTRQGIQENAPLLEKIAIERIRVEFEKLLLGQNPTAGLKDLLVTDLYRYCPRLADQKTALEQLLDLKQWHLKTEAEAWAVLMQVMRFDHPQRNAFLKAWKTSNDLISDVQKIVPTVQAILNDQLTPKLLFDTGDRLLLSANRVAAMFGHSLEELDLRDRYQALPIKSTKELAVNGGQLIKLAHVKPGPKMGQILHQLQQRVLDRSLPNDQNALLAAAAQLAKEED